MLNDQLIFLNFWADWCAPCIKEFPYFNELDKNPNVTVIGFHFDQFDVLEDEVVEGFIKKFNIFGSDNLYKDSFFLNTYQINLLYPPLFTTTIRQSLKELQ